VTVNSNGQSANCDVVVADQPSSSCTVTVTAAPSGNIVVNANVPAKWTITGPATLSEAAGATTKTYGSQPTGTYTITPVTDPLYGAPTVSPSGSSGILSSGTTLTFTLTYDTTGGATVDIKANGSDTPSAVPAGSNVLLAWTSSSITSGSCVASGGWSGSKGEVDSETVSVPSETTYTITCSSLTGLGLSDNVTVPVRLAQCYDGLDNDEDGTIDSADSGCPSTGGSCFGPTCDDDEGAANPQCSDGVDNTDSEDALIDENDPGCTPLGVYNPNDDDESDISGAVTQCNNGIDDDGDGTIDFGGAGTKGPDNGCKNALDPLESDDPDIREI
jgi:hypothetical protein